ncbi:condensation domain-containing protein, partial [Acetivibrio straminisolvens]|uniref:condensation domain-containing protein n=1 Tax=Acetivibrio straminisolvens TaxID=253314 RepID=UPI00103993BD
MYKLNSHTSKLDLKLDVYLDKTGSIECIIEYNTALFKKETIERLAKHFANITREVLQKPNKKISEIEMLTREEKEQILFDFNDTNKEYPKEKTLSQVFEEQAERTPDN